MPPKFRVQHPKTEGRSARQKLFARLRLKQRRRDGNFRDLMRGVIFVRSRGIGIFRMRVLFRRVVCGFVLAVIVTLGVVIQITASAPWVEHGGQQKEHC